MFMKRLLLIIVIALFIAPFAHSVATDAFIVSISPSNLYAVAIDTGGNTTDFGNMTLDQVRCSTYSAFAAGTPSSATVRNTGSAQADWQISTAKLDTWDLRPRSSQDLNNTALATDTGTLCLVLVPAATCYKSVDNANFSNDDMLDAVAGNWYNMYGSSFTVYTNKTTDTGIPEDGNNVAVNSMRQIYVRMRTPHDTTVSGTQRYQISIRALAASTF